MKKIDIVLYILFCCFYSCSTNKQVVDYQMYENKKLFIELPKDAKPLSFDSLSSLGSGIADVI
ncbi:MAG: hypothetical protein ACK5L7_06915, partial [Paludibacteraceae bacterium]